MGPDVVFNISPNISSIAWKFIWNTILFALNKYEIETSIYLSKFANKCALNETFLIFDRVFAIRINSKIIHHTFSVRLICWAYKHSKKNFKTKTSNMHVLYDWHSEHMFEFPLSIVCVRIVLFAIIYEDNKGARAGSNGDEVDVNALNWIPNERMHTLTVWVIACFAK